MSSPIAAAMLSWIDEHGDRGVFATDTSLCVQSWGRWLELLTGRPAADVVGRPLVEVFPSLVERGFDQYYAEALGGEVKVLSHSLHRFILPGPGEVPRPQRGQIGPLTLDGQIVGTITIIEDVSERVAAERELRARIHAAERARATAEDASRVKDEFLATVSHEIRTPLNAVLGWTRILRSREYDRATFDRAIEVIDRNATAQLTLISDLLDMARIATGKVRLDMVDTDLTAIVSGAIEGLRPAADAKGVHLETVLEPELPSVSGDRDRLLQVVWNLLSNAVKFTDSGGRVKVSLAATDRGVRLAVADTGHGIAPAFLAQVFERFKQADPSSARRHGGLGLGLALVRELVELHGGTVAAHSDGVGKGSTFVVQLPARPAKTAVRRTHRPASPDPAMLRGLRLLVVEDDGDAREILVRTVEDAGAVVTAVGSVAEALALLREQRITADTVITDIGMPGDDGFTLLDELRKLPPDLGGTVPAIAVTAYATVEDRKRALDAGFAAHIGKPYAPNTLIGTIARAVGYADRVESRRDLT